jgi:hypothetical protein
MKRQNLKSPWFTEIIRARCLSDGVRRFPVFLLMVALALSLACLPAAGQNLKLCNNNYCYIDWPNIGPGNVPTDQSKDQNQPQQSFLAAWNQAAKNPDNVYDADLKADTIQMRTQGVSDFMWVFGQCFGSGMFDDLNQAMLATQAGMSASTYNEGAYYPDPKKKEVDFIDAFLAGFNQLPLNKLPVTAQNLAAYAAAQDGFGPNPKFNNLLEHPVFFSLNGGEKLNLKDKANGGTAILYSGLPNVEVDNKQIALMIQQLTAYGFKLDHIFLLYKNGFVRFKAGKNNNNVTDLGNVVKKSGLGQGALKAQVRAADSTTLGDVVQNRLPADTKFLFFFANDHGGNTVIMGGAAIPRIGPGLPMGQASGTPDNENPGDEPEDFAGIGDMTPLQ